ncbi:MAG TPA: hypothetical protein VH353_14505 [Caulobacteraceae bacterium]|jgi:hypothetical protein|nr:hypothetical protein [Caulobacteraceae bacterium]
MKRAVILGGLGALMLAHAAAAAPSEAVRQACQTRWAELRGTSAAAGWTQSRFIAHCLRQRRSDARAHAGAPTGPILAATAAAAGVSAAVAATHRSEKPASP